MTEQNNVGNLLYNFFHTEIEGFDSLAELALDLRWSWNHSADELWKQLDPGLWELTHNPWVVLQTTSKDKLKHLLGDSKFRKKINDLMDTKKNWDSAPGWFQHNHPQSPLSCAAYFSMEFMLSEALPIYSGGLGNVAGDQLKATSDLNIPVVGVGLLYQQGYFRQVIDKNGVQEALFPYNDPGQLPITPLRQANGEWLRLEVALPGYSVWVRAWQVQVGRRKLYLLDSNDAANFPVYRGITSELYGGGPDLRLKQELILGIGGWRLLRALNLRPEVCHLNEGHAAFAILERARDFMVESGQSFDVALAVTRAGNLFTTHTSVEAGFDRFPPSLIEHYLSQYARNKLGISTRDLLALGRCNPDDANENFNMAYLAVRGSGAINGVSRLHGKVSKQIFRPLFPRRAEDEVPIGYVTNGVHMPSWDSKAADDLWTEACGKERWLGTTENLEKEISTLSDERLWEFRMAAGRSLIEYTRKRLSEQLAINGAAPDEIEKAKQVFTPNALILGFARRFATYKRPNLLLHDPGRLIKLLSNPERPVQLILAGKAHPADKAGQDLIRQWTQFIHDFKAQSHVIFLSDYDMLLTEHLVQGVDVWINTPRRPWEACGTSGMKVLVNGGLNISELDGWWAEAYSPDLGWALGDGKEHDDDPIWDTFEANALYDLLEREVIPEFFTRNQKGIPIVWVAKMRESMARLTPKYSANRTVREYTEKYYIPAAEAYKKRAADQGINGKELVNWQHTLNQKWPSISFGEITTQTKDSQHIFNVQVNLNGLDPHAVRVELYATGITGNGPDLNEMKRVTDSVDPSGRYQYNAVISAERPSSDYTARVVPNCDGVSIPLEANQILWQR